MDHHIQEDSRRRCSKELNEETVRFKVGTSNLPKLTANRWSETSKSAETMQRFLIRTVLMASRAPFRASGELANSMRPQ